MSLRIRYNLFKVKRQISSPRQFKRALWAKLSRRWDEGGLPRFAWYQVPLLRWSLASLAGLVIVGSIGTGAYAYTSPAVTEGTSLYPLKLKLEAWEERLYWTPEQQAKFYLKRIQRREAEQRILEQRRRKVEKTAEQVKRIEEKLEKVEQQFDERTPSTLKQKVRERLERRTEWRERRLEAVESRGRASASSVENRSATEFRKSEKEERQVKINPPPPYPRSRGVSQISEDTNF